MNCKGTDGTQARYMKQWASGANWGSREEPGERP